MSIWLLHFRVFPKKPLCNFAWSSKSHKTECFWELKEKKIVIKIIFSGIYNLTPSLRCLCIIWHPYLSVKLFQVHTENFKYTKDGWLYDTKCGFGSVFRVCVYSRLCIEFVWSRATLKICFASCLNTRLRCVRTQGWAKFILYSLEVTNWDQQVSVWLENVSAWSRNVQNSPSFQWWDKC